MLSTNQPRGERHPFHEGGRIAAWDVPRLMTSKTEGDKFEENGPFNGPPLLRLTVTLSRVSTNKAAPAHQLRRGDGAPLSLVCPVTPGVLRETAN